MTMSQTHQFSVVKRRWTSVRLCDVCGKESHDDAAAKAHFFSDHVRESTALSTGNPAPRRKPTSAQQLEGALLLQCLDRVLDMNRVNIAANSGGY